ncbi:hypothetical protein PR048_004881 [Dryococelus australis]|uniref:Uncharacterized protein n=1 Tax=Dryococelus australis TaxID=614101 RepID=A0ABQ9I6P1_9NEOP|nr:hypothetical protein PR048_004881 [Dryococelus australis]
MDLNFLKKKRAVTSGAISKLFTIFYVHDCDVYVSTWKKYATTPKTRTSMTVVQQMFPHRVISRPSAPSLTRFVCLRFISLGSPGIKSLRLKTSTNRRAENRFSRRNCNCAGRNVL